MVKSEIGGGVVESPAYFADQRHVDDQNGHRQDHVQPKIYDSNRNKNSEMRMQIFDVSECPPDRH